MKQEVLEFLQNLPNEGHEQFNKAFELYRKSEGKNLGVERVLNASGYSPRSLDNLLYDLQKMHGITDVERSTKYEVSPSTAPRMTQEDTKSLEVPIIDLKTESDLLQVTQSSATKKLREEFPFLSDKNCPDEFKILIADKITAWNSYVQTQEIITKVEAGELVLEEKDALLGLAKMAIEYFDKNQKIYNELNHYAETGTVLGLHPIFKTVALKREVDVMNTDELVKYKLASAKYFSTNKRDLDKAIANKKQDKVDTITARVAEREEKLVLVNKKLSSL